MSDASHFPQDSEEDTVQISAGTHLFLVVVFVGFFSFVAWAAMGRLDIVSHAKGEVVPASQVKEVQHLEGGIVSKILVKEGDRVVANQPLVALQSVGTGSDLDELRIRLANQQVKIIRLNAEIRGDESPPYPEEFQKKYPELVERDTQLFHSRMKRRAHQVRAQQEVILQRKHEIAEILERLKSNRAIANLYKEQIAISEKLLRQDLSNRMQHITYLMDESRVKGQISEDEQALKRIQSSIQESEAKEQSILDAFQEEAQNELIETVGQEKELLQRLRKSEDSFNRTLLLSPVDGIVKTLYVVTVGGVVPPGGTVLDIVPGKDLMIIEAELPTQDIGFVRPGQQVTIRLASADSARLGVINGKVHTISPDTHVNKEGTSFYKIQVKPDRYYFSQQGVEYPLVPGMQVVCSIITGDRTVLNFLLEPMIGSVGTALQER